MLLRTSLWRAGIENLTAICSGRAPTSGCTAGRVATRRCETSDTGRATGTARFLAVAARAGYQYDAHAYRQHHV